MKKSLLKPIAKAVSRQNQLWQQYEGNPNVDFELQILQKHTKRLEESLIEQGIAPTNAIKPQFINRLANTLDYKASLWVKILIPRRLREVKRFWESIREPWRLSVPKFQNMAMSVAATAVVCLLLFSNGIPAPVAATPTEAGLTATKSYTSSLDYLTYARSSSHFCNSIQPEPTPLSLECGQNFTLWPEPEPPQYRGGYSKF